MALAAAALMGADSLTPATWITEETRPVGKKARFRSTKVRKQGPKLLREKKQFRIKGLRP